jgi:hypothetical protein
VSEDDEPDTAALQAEKDKRGGIKKGKNGSKVCNWWVGDATTGHYCGKTAGYSADKTTGLFRCIDHGGDRDQLKRGRTSDGKTESRNACPCREHGTRCTHGRGCRAQKSRCATCHAGECTLAHHQTGRHARPPPDAAGV